MKPPKQRKTAFPEVFKVKDNDPVSPMQIEQQQREEQFMKTEVHDAISQNSLDKLRFDFQGHIIPSSFPSKHL